MAQQRTIQKLHCLEVRRDIKPLFHRIVLALMLHIDDVHIIVITISHSH